MYGKTIFCFELVRYKKSFPMTSQVWWTMHQGLDPCPGLHCLLIHVILYVRKTVSILCHEMKYKKREKGGTVRHIVSSKGPDMGEDRTCWPRFATMLFSKVFFHCFSYLNSHMNYNAFYTHYTLRQWKLGKQFYLLFSNLSTECRWHVTLWFIIKKRHLRFRSQ